MSRFSNLIDQLDNLNQQDIKNTSHLLGVTASLYERLQTIVNSQQVPIAELPEAEIITKELLKKKFSNFHAARNAYKKKYGISDQSWDQLIAKVKHLPIPPFPISLEERVQTLEETVKVLSDTLLQLIDREH